MSTLLTIIITLLLFFSGFICGIIERDKRYKPFLENVAKLRSSQMTREQHEMTIKYLKETNEVISEELIKCHANNLEKVIIYEDKVDDFLDEKGY